jgi:hypothetical protein
LAAAVQRDLRSDGAADPFANIAEQNTWFANRLRSLTHGWTRDQKIALLALLATIFGYFLGSADVEIDIDLPDIHIGDKVTVNQASPNEDDWNRILDEAVRRAREQSQTQPSEPLPPERRTGHPGPQSHTDPSSE